MRNSSDRAIRLGIKINDPFHRAEQVSSICIGDDCFTNFDVLEVTTLNPGETLEDVRVEFKAGYDEITRELSVTFYDIESPNRKVTERFKYHIENNFPSGLLFGNELLQISKVYPNPVSSSATIDYTLTDRAGDATISIHNILGDQVMKVSLDRYESSLKLPIDQFTNGIYFYTLQLNGTGVTTKKFVVRK
ncbi:MAG: T9SS type A sorting domain-containing protein [Cyclobacteriaceae bacterium]